MAKTYLNQKERNDVLVLASFKVYMGELAEKFEKLKRPKDMIKYTKMSRTFCNKVLQAQLEGLNKKEIEKILLESKKMNVSVKYKDQALREFEEVKKMDDIFPIKTNDLLDLCEDALLNCRRCKKIGEEAVNCRLRQILFEIEIEPFNYDATGNECQYYDDREEI